MFDLRYHIASLASVFIALVLGILLGVAISGRGFVDKSERTRFQNRIGDLESRLDNTGKRLDDLETQQASSQTVIAQAYPVLMKDRLKGKRIALLVIGAGAGETGSDVEDALDDAGANVVRYRALKVPIDAGAIRRDLESRPALRAYAGERQLDDVGRELAAEFVTGGKTPLWDALARLLVEQQRAGLERAADGVVLVRAARPQFDPSARLIGGLYTGLASSGVPVVGAESTGTPRSAVKVWRDAGLSSVDDVDTLPGRLALAFVLAGAKGQYGVKETALNGPLPALR